MMLSLASRAPISPPDTTHHSQSQLLTGSIQRGDALLLSSLVDLHRQRGLARRHVHDNASLLVITGRRENDLQSSEDTLLAEIHLAHVLGEATYDRIHLRRPDNRENDVRMFGDLSGSVRDDSTLRGQFLALLGSAVVLAVSGDNWGNDGGLVALLHHVATHGLAHHANADEANTRILRIHSARKKKSI